jgi:DNA-binding CsgD family transcriptional regulator
MLSLSFFFGWLLSFPFNGPALFSLAGIIDINPIFSGFVFMIFHALGLLLTGLLKKNQSDSKKWMVLSVWVCILISVLLRFFTMQPWWTLLIAGLGLVSGLFIINWSHLYTNEVSSPVRLKFMAGTMVGAYLVYMTVNLSSALGKPDILYIEALGSLVLSLWFTLQCDYSFTLEKRPKEIKVPKLLMMLLCVIVLVLFINGGLMYGIIFPTFTGYDYLARLFREPAYIITLLIVWFFASRIRRTLPIYFGCALLGFAFIIFKLFQTSMAGFILTEVFFQSGMAMLDLFLWFILAEIAYVYGRPGLIFGLGLTANVLAVFIGGWTGELLLNNVQDIYSVTAVYAWGTISTVLFLAPFLTERLDRDLAGKISKSLTDAEKTEFDLEIIPNNQNLTAKERELIHLTLDGMTNKEIAVQMGITENTVKTHLKHIYAKTGILNKNQLLAMFLNTFSQ